MAPASRPRTLILSLSIAAITATGAWYGAGLKTKREMKQVVAKRREATAEDKIKQLENVRAGLVARKMGLEVKLREVEGRIGRRDGG